MDYTDLVNRWLEENYSRLYAFALATLQHRADAEDAVCEAAVILLTKQDACRDVLRFNAYAWGVLRHVLMRHGTARARRMRDVDVDDWAERIADTETLPPAETLVMAEERGRVRRALAALPKETRLTLEARYIRGQSYREIAEDMEIPLSTVTGRLHDGKQQLRKEWDTMDHDFYMKNGYYTAQDLRIDVRYRSRRPIPTVPLDNLLAKTVAAVCYDRPITVTEMSHITGVPAVYLEEVTARLLEAQLLTQTANRYQTAFPILARDVWERLRTLVRETTAPYFAAWTRILIDCAEKAPFGAHLTTEERTHLLFFSTSRYLRNDPFKTDDADFPHRNADGAWCVKAYTPAIDPDAVFPIEHFFLDSVVQLHFNAEQNWFVYDDEEALPVLLEKLRTGEERGVVWDSRAAYLAETACVKPLTAQWNVDCQALHDRLMPQAMALLPERFRETRSYLLCEVRNFIEGLWEEYLLETRAVSPAGFVVFRAETPQAAPSDGVATYY